MTNEDFMFELLRKVADVLCLHLDLEPRVDDKIRQLPEETDEPTLTDTSPTPKS